MKYDLAVLLLLLHIVFDKGFLSDSNKKRVNEYLFLYKNERFFLDLPKDYFELFLNINSLEINNRIELLKQSASSCEFLSKFKKAKKYINKTNRNCKWRYRLHRLERKSIAIIGVDGTGKSTTVNELSRLLGNLCPVQYMGFKNMETKYGKEYETVDPIRPKVLRYIYVWKEMKYRYKKYRYRPSGITIFDRFPWEAYDNSIGAYKIVYWFLFKLLFPKPKRVYYIYCSVNTSLKRKNDIHNEEIFIAMKERFDKKYKNKYISFNSDNETVEEIVNSICEDIMNNGMFEYLF